MFKLKVNKRTNISLISKNKEGNRYILMFHVVSITQLALIDSTEQTE